MTAPQGLATFPGIGQLLDASFSLGHGISPSTATLTIVPQAQLPSEVGSLVLSYGGEWIEFPGCKVDRGSFERNSRGEIWRLSILDRRWKWRFGAISGTYNARRDNASLRRGENSTINTERSPQQLAALCLQAMGETSFDVSALPSDPRPDVEWSVDVPAEMLAALCDQFSCRVVLQLDNRVVIHRTGVGASLSAAGALEFSEVINPPERPDALAVVCGPNRYQVDFALEAVGLEATDAQGGETIKKLDSLSYRPSAGWSRADFPYFHQVGPAFRNLAQRSVFRYYRIRSPLKVPGFKSTSGAEVSLEQLLPLEDEQVSVAAENSQLSNRPAAVFGVWHADAGDVVNSAPSLAPAPDLPADQGQRQVYTRPYTIDTARGLVIFDEPVYRNTHASAGGGSGFEVQIGPADLVLRAACSVRDAQSLEPARYIRQRSLGDPLSATVRYLKHDEIVLTHTPRYSNNYTLEGVDTNKSMVNESADYWLDAAQLEYQTTTPQTVRYPGLVRVELDGAIEHVGFHIGAGGTTTTATRQSEPTRGDFDHALRRRFQRQRDAEGLLQKTRPRQLAQSVKSNSATKLRPRMAATTSVQPLAKIAFKNIDTQAAPPCAMLEVTGAVIEDGVAFLTCRRPGETLRHEFAVNGPVLVDAGAKGVCFRQGDVAVAFDTGSSEDGASWGPRAGQWTASKGYPNVITAHVVRSQSGKILHGAIRPLTSVVGIADTPIGPAVDLQPGQGTVRLYVLNGSQFVAAQPTTTFTGYNPFPQPIAANTLTRYTRVCGIWLAANVEREDQKLVKSMGNISPAGGSGQVKRWRLNDAGVEVEVDPAEEFTARNRTSARIEPGQFCLALLIDGKWYVEPWECEGEASG